jgi:hypothetical protein
VKNFFGTVAISLLLLLSGCADHHNSSTAKDATAKDVAAKNSIEKNNSSTISVAKRNKVFKKLMKEIIDAIEKGDFHNRSDKIWEIYERELFCDVGFCGEKPFHTLLKVAATFSRAKSDFPAKVQKKYSQLQKYLVQDLEELSRLNVVASEDHYVFTMALDRIFFFHLYSFINENRSVLTDCFFNFVCKTTEDSANIPLGFIAALPNTYLEEPLPFPNTDLEAVVFSLDNSDSKIIAFIEGCCEASVYRMYLFDPRNGKKVEKIDIHTKYPYVDDNRYFPCIMVGHSDLKFDKKKNIFSVGHSGDAEDARKKYTLDLKSKKVRDAGK